MRLLFTILMALTICLDGFAGTPVTGTVVQASDQSPIAGANVLLKNVEGKLLAYGVTLLHHAARDKWGAYHSCHHNGIPYLFRPFGA